MFVVDEDIGIPPSVIEKHCNEDESVPLALSERKGGVPSMSDFVKTPTFETYGESLNSAHAVRPQHYRDDSPWKSVCTQQATDRVDVLDYNSTARSDHGQDYTTFASHPAFSSQYAAAQSQVPSGLPQSAATLGLMSQNQGFGTHDPAYYGQQPVQYPTYLPSAPRELPQINSYTPSQGTAGTKVTVYFRSVYDLDSPRVNIVLRFGRKQCESLLQRTAQHSQMYHYALSAEAPALVTTKNSSPVPLQLVLNDGTVTWESPTQEIGTFTYQEPLAYYAPSSPPLTGRKRKLSMEASPRRSPAKKSSMVQLNAPAKSQPQIYVSTAATGAAPSSPFRRPSAPETQAYPRRFGGSEYQQAYNTPFSATPAQNYYAIQAGSATPSLHSVASPSWSYAPTVHSDTRSPSMASTLLVNKGVQMLSSAAAVNPPLIRTSTLQTSPANTPNPATSSAGFNPYSMYAANSKAVLKIEGDLNGMTENWSPVEKEAKRRLVQFRRSQAGNVITTSFEAVTLEDRIPNSICVSCIKWAEKGNECYVTSVDTISLLESLVAVRFTVEEKNRIRRNLEGFRPATVSKVKQDSEEFFKLIMGFPNPKPRNIEKDVKVFPWRILATALKKIISKYVSLTAPWICCCPLRVLTSA